MTAEGATSPAYNTCSPQKLGHDDSDRALLAFKGIEDSRLTYQRPIDERL